MMRLPQSWEAGIGRAIVEGAAGLAAGHESFLKTALQDDTAVVKCDGMSFSRHAEAGHSDPFLVSGGYQGSPLKERRNYDF